jgi:hypothetical protein
MWLIELMLRKVVTMDFQAIMGQLNRVFGQLNEDDPPVNLYDDYGNEYHIIGIYTEDEPVICIDIKREVG